MQLENRVAIITGAGRGIGQAIALAYAKEGAKLALAARTLSELEETAQQAKDLGAEVLVLPTDIADPVQVDEMVRRTVTQRFEETRQQMFAQVVAKFGTSAAVSMEQVTGLAIFLGSDASGNLSGRCFEAFDDFLALPPKIPEIMTSDTYTLRRVEPGWSG